MIIVDFGAKFGPRVWIGTEEVTSRCCSLEFLPGNLVRVRLFVVPHVVDTLMVDSGFGVGVLESEMRKQVIQGNYQVIGCPDCTEEE